MAAINKRKMTKSMTKKWFTPELFSHGRKKWVSLKSSSGQSFYRRQFKSCSKHENHFSQKSSLSPLKIREILTPAFKEPSLECLTYKAIDML